MDIKKYLKDNNAQKQIDKIAKKCKNKRVVFYGAGQYFDEIRNEYDISAFNVNGIADLKFVKQRDTNKTPYKTLVPDDLKTYDYDAIVITLYDDLNILHILENKILKGTKNENVKIYPMITPTLSYLLKKLFEKV